MQNYFWSVLALVLIFEGMLPFLCPGFWRRILLRLSLQKNASLRLMGFFSMLLGVILLYFIK